MLKKLLKYEFRSVGRQLIPLYLGVLGLAIVNHFFWFTSSRYDISLIDGIGSIPLMLTMAGYLAVCVALGVITLLLIIQRFYKGLLTEEGYLMFTLPCRPWQLIAAKGITASAMCLAAGLVGILSILLMAMGARDWGVLLEGFFKIRWGELFELHALWPLYFVEAIVLLIVAIFSSIGHMYVSIAIGHLFKKHRIALAIVAYILINMAWSTICVTSVNLISHHFDYWRWINRNGPWGAHLFFLTAILSQVIPTVIYFIGTNWILSNKLNLE